VRAGKSDGLVFELGMRCSFVLPALFLPVIYSLQCCNTTSSNGTGYSTTETPNLTTTDQMSLCLWAKPRHDKEYDLVSYIDPKKEHVLYISTRQVIFYNYSAATNSKFNKSNSTHLCVTWQIDKGVNTYINGKLHLDVELSPDVRNTTEVDFTGSWFAGLQKTEGKKYPSEGGLNGSLCGFTIWAEELSSDHISKLFNNKSGSNYQIDGTQDTEAVVLPAPSYTWQNFTHHNYENVDDSFCSSSRGKGHGIRLGGLDPVASKFVILFLVIIGVIIGFAGLFMCSEREIAIKRAQKRLKDEDNFSIDNASTHSVT